MTAIVRRANSVSNRPLGRPLRRLALLGSTALVGSALAAGQAGAQSLPDLANAGGASVVFSGPGGGAPNDTMSVDLGGVSRVLDFNSYNIAAGNTANYATSVPSVTDLVAVNRVITSGGGPSLIDGTISAASGISVWLINQEGISYNGNAMLAGGSLMLSTLDFADPVDGTFRTAFAAPGAATGTAFSFAGSSTSPILIGGNLSVTGSIVAVGQQITTDGALTAGNGSVVLVAASAVTFTNGLGNPLAFSVDAGTTLGSVDVNANLTGQSVVVAGGVQNSMTAALLNVDAAATLTATAANGTVTLATSSVGPDIAITNGAGGAPGIATSGRLLATGVGGDVRVQSAGDLTGGGVIAANGDVNLAAAGDISAATGNYTATNGALSASADGDATLGALTAGTDVTVAAGGSATLAGAANAGGALDVTASASVTLAAVTTGTDVTIDAGGDTVVTGAVVAGRDFIVANTENYTQSGTVVAERDVTLGVNDDAVVTGAITATDGDFFATVGNDATFAAITAGGDITATVGSDGDFAGALVAGGDVDLTAGPSLFVRAAVTSGDDYVLTAEDITLGDAATSPIQSAARRVFIHALNGNITGLGGLSLRSGADGSGFGNLELQADVGEVRFGLATALVAGTAGARTDVAISSAPNIALGDVTAARLYTLGDPTFGTLTASGTITTRDLAIDNALSIVSTGGAITTRNVTIGAPAAALQFYAPGAVTSTGTLATNGGNILVSSGGAITLGNAATALSGLAPTSGSIGLQATGTISAGTLAAGTDIAAQAGGTIAVTTARAGDDIDFASTSGNVSLGTGTASGTGAGGTGLVFAPAPGIPGAIGFGAEDAQLGQSTIRLRSQGADVASATQLTTANGDVIVNAGHDAVLGAVTATGIGTGGIIAVRAGRDVRATALTSTSDDISVGADGNALLGTLTASDDIDLTVDGSLDWGTLRLTGGSDTARFANLTGTAGTSGGVNFLVPGVDLALAGNVVRIRAGSVGTAAAGPVGLIAQDVTSGDFTATALAGDIRIGDVTSSGNVTVIATLGSVTGLPGGYAPASGGVITGVASGSGDGLVDTVLLDIGTTGAIGAITAGSVTSTGTATTLRIGTINAGTVNLGAVQTLDLGSVTATGAVTLATSGGSALGANLEIIAPDTLLAEGFGAANLDSDAGDGFVRVSALNGIAQLGLVAAGTGTGTGAGGTDQIVVNARALTIVRADALDGSIAVTASHGLLGIDTGNAAQDVTLVKRNDDLASIGSDTTTDILKVGELSGTGGSLSAGGAITVRSETSLILNSATAQGGDILATAAGDMLVTRAIASTGSIGLYGGTWIRGDIDAPFAPIDGTLTAAGDVTIRAAGNVEYREISAGDDVDIFSTGGDILVRNVTSTGLGAGGSSVLFGPTPGLAGAVTVIPGEDAALTGATIRLRAATGSILASPGLIRTIGTGDILVNAFDAVRLDDIAAGNGSLGIRAGGSIATGDLSASHDIAVLGGASGALAATDVTIASALAGDDLAVTALNGDIVIGSGTAQGIVGRGGTSVAFTAPAGSANAVGVAFGETPVFVEGTASLRSEIGDIDATSLSTLRGDVLVNAAGAVSLGLADAGGGSVGVLAGGTFTAGTLVADADITALAGTAGSPVRTDIFIASATAGDDIDLTVLNGNLTLTDGAANGGGITGNSVTFEWAPGVDGAVRTIASEDMQLGASTLRLRSRSGDVFSTGTLASPGGNVLVNAFGNVGLNIVDARSGAAGDAGTLGILAGGSVDAASLFATRDIVVQSGSLSPGGITIGTAIAGDDIDLAAITGDLALSVGTSLGSAESGGTSIVFIDAPGGPLALGTSPTEDLQLGGATIRLRAEAGNIASLAVAGQPALTGTLRTEGEGDVLVNAFGSAALGTVEATGGSIGILAGGQVAATTLTALRDIGIRGGTAGALAPTDVTVTTATAGDDIDIEALNGNLVLTTGTSTGTPGTGGTSVAFIAAPGVALPGTGAVTVDAAEALPAVSSITLRSQVGDVTATTLHTRGTGDVFVNAARNASVGLAQADGGSIGLLAGTDAAAGTLLARVDIGISAGRDALVTTARAGDDIDVVAGRNLALLSGTSLATGGTGGSSVVLGTAGVAGATAVDADPANEDPQLAAATIRLRAAGGSIAGEFATPLGTTLATTNGDILLNAAGDVTVRDANAGGGSIGALAGGAITATTLVATRDIGARARGNVAITAATAGDDIDLVSLAGNVVLTDGTATGLGTGGIRPTFPGAPGSIDAVAIEDGEDAQLGGSAIRLRAEAGSVTSTGTLSTQRAGDILVNASGDVSLTTVNAAAGSIGVLAGRQVTATSLTASRDIGVQGGTGVGIGSATAGDDIDVVALTGNLVLTDGTANGTAATGGTSVRYRAGVPAGSIDAVEIGGEDAQLGGTTIRLRAAAGNVTSTGTLSALGTGEVLVNASGDVSLATVNANGGSIGVLAGGQIVATSLTASRDIGVQGGTIGAAAATDVTIASATAGDDIDVVALNGNLALAGGTSTGLGAGGTSLVFTGAPGSAAAVAIGAEDAQLTAATIRLRAQVGDVTSTGALLAQGTGNVLVNAADAATLNAATATAGSIGVLAGGQVTATSLTAGRDIGVQGGTGVGIGSATAGDDIDIVALTGNLVLTDGTANGAATTGGTSVLYRAGAPAGSLDAVEIGGEDAQLGGSTIRLRAARGNVTSTGTLSALGTGEVLVNASGDVSLATVNAAAGSIGVLAGGQVTATSLTASRDVGVQSATGITVGTASAGDDIDMVALGGNLALANGTSTGASGAGGTSVSYGPVAGAAAAVMVGSGEDAQLAGAGIRLRAAAGNVTSTGTLRTQGTGDVLVNARGDVTLATTTASAGSVALLAGRNLTAATTSASEDVAARAATDATLTTITAGDDIEITASGLVTTGAGRIASGATGLDARHGLLDTAQAGQVAGITLAAGDARGPKGLPAGSDLANAANGRSITIEAANVAIQGILETTGRITLRNTGTAPTVVGDGTITTGASFALANAELARLRSSTLVVDSGTRALELGTLAIDPATGTVDTRFLTTGAVEITGAVTVATTTGPQVRTLQIGGLLGELGDDAGSVPLASEIVARIDRTSRPRIDAGSAHVDLRGAKILFGTSTMVAEYIGKTNDEIAAIVANPTSKLYSEATAQPLDVFLTARQVTVGYRNFALFQNTDINLSTGVLINSPPGGLPDQTALALRLVSTGEGGNNSFAMFGVVNNFSGTPAALLTNEAIEIVNPTGDPNDFRVTRASSRINGCVIGAPDRGCLATDIPQPNFNLYDERKVALFDVEDEGTIAVSPLIGRGNDGLIVNVADAPVGIDTIECRPEDPSCPAKEGN